MRLLWFGSALALVVALIAASIVPAYAGQAGPQCAAPSPKAAHDCCKTPILAACCSNRSDQSDQSAPAQSRVQVNPNVSAAVGILVVDRTSAARTVRAIDSTPPRAGPVDLPTLLSTLLL